MNYKNHYESLIERAKERDIDEYTEIHHIKPRCLGGTDEKTNLVKLTAREHFVAHQLLVKIYPNHGGLIGAIFYMTCGNEFRSNRIYEWHRKRFSSYMKEKQSGLGNSQYGTRWIHNLELKKSKKIPKGDELPMGWNEGRKIKFDDRFIQYKVFPKKLWNEYHQRVHINKIYSKFINGDYKSLRDFCNKEYDKSIVSLTKMFKKYVLGYNPEHGKRYLPRARNGNAADC